MARINSEQRVTGYTVDFKIKVVELTEQLDVTAAQIASVLGLHPIMVYRWRQEYRNGKFTATPSRTIRMTKKTKPPTPSTEEESELKQLKRELADLKKENDFLKKWDRYLKDQKQNDSAS